MSSINFPLIQQMIILTIAVLTLLFWIVTSTFLIRAFLSTDRGQAQGINIAGLAALWRGFSAFLFSFCSIVFFVSTNENGTVALFLGPFEFRGAVGGVVLWGLAFMLILVSLSFLRFTNSSGQAGTSWRSRNVEGP